jgi:hypothetical protein
MNNIKHLLTALIFLISFTVYGQIEKDSVVVNYIESQSEFIGLNDLSRIPESIKPYIKSIKDYMGKNLMHPDDYWICSSSIQEDSNPISIPIRHYNTFVCVKEVEEKNEEAKKNRQEDGSYLVAVQNGNISGKDGTLEIDKSSKEVLSFKLGE